MTSGGVGGVGGLGTTSGVLSVTEGTFADVVIGSPLPVLVEIGARWCTPCCLLEPVLAELAFAYDGRVRIVTVDSDENPAIVSAYQVTSIPTVLLVVQGEERRRLIGARPKPVLRRELDALLDAA